MEAAVLKDKATWEVGRSLIRHYAQAHVKAGTTIEKDYPYALPWDEKPEEESEDVKAQKRAAAAPHMTRALMHMVELNNRLNENVKRDNANPDPDGSKR